MDEPTNMLLHEIFQNQARKSPESCALEHPHGRLTYRELNEQSNSLSWYLRETLSPGRGVVALSLEKSPLLVIAVLAVLKAGMIWIPLPDDASADRIQYILQSSNAGLLLGSASSSALHAGADIPFTSLDKLLQHGQLRAYSTEDPDHATIDAGRSEHDLCHILFTSGSTGTPKGVMIEHRAVRHNALELTKMFGLDSQTRTLQFAAPTFDIFGLDLFMTFACGGCLIMAPREAMMEDMTAFLKRKRVTYAQLTPTVIQTIDPSGVPDLRVLASSGEILPQQLADKWRHAVHLFNAYGPTETIVCTVEDLSTNTDIDAGCVGRAVPGLDVRILADGETRSVSAGEVGEICVAGPQILRGYLSKSAATEERTLSIDGVRFYRTGDLGFSHVSPTGVSTIKLIGRKDTEVKIRGIRLDLADVEASIISCSDARKCVVLMPRQGLSSGRLCAFLVLDADSNNTLLPPNKPRFRLLEPSREISSVLHRVQSTTSAQLPPMAIPKTWWPIDEIPLTSSGKIDRLHLQSWLEELGEDMFRTLIDQYRAVSQDDRRGAGSAEERCLQSVWAEVLLRSVATIEVTDSLADLGADSLDVIRMANGARKANIPVNAADIFAAKTIQEVVRRHVASGLTVSEAQSLSPAPYRPFELTPPGRPLAPLIEEAASSCGVALASVEDIYPCTPYQSALMALDIKCPGSYLCIFSWTLLRDIEISRLQRAWNDMLDFNPALRNRLIWDASAQQLLQVQVRRDHRDWSESLYEAPMTLGSDLCRGLARWDEKRGRWTFHLKIHHSIIDGWSLSLMLNQLKKLYFDEPVNAADSPPYAHYVRHYLTEQQRLEKSSHEFWTDYLQGFGESGSDSFLSKPQDSHRQVHATDHQTYMVTLDLKELATRFGVTPAVILYGITALIFATHSDVDDVSLGLIRAGREAPVDGVYQMIGPVFACVPFRTEVDRQRSLADFFQQIHAQILAIGPHQQFGLERIKNCGPGAKAACNLETLVVVQPEDERLAGTGLWEEVHGQTSGLADSIPFSLELIPGDKGVLINCNSDPACIVRQHAQIIMEHLNQALLSLTNLSAKATVQEIQMTPENHSSRLRQWADAYGPPVDVCLHNLLEMSANKFADSNAVYQSSTGKTLSFKELNDASTRLAAFLLQSCHVPEGAVVPIAMEKSALAVVAIFAILKTGSAYLPIDPSWPLERVRRIVDDAGASALICSTSLKSQYESLGKQLIALDETHLNPRDSGTRTSSVKITRKGRPSDLAVLMYTSGSTGTPKGVMLEHRAMSTSLTHLARVFGLQPGYRHLQFSAFVYDVSISDIFIPLISGACICIPTEDERLNGLSEAVRKMKINSAILTPSMAGLIRLEDGESLKTIMTGGEMTNRGLIRTWAPRIRLLNAYGPTEAAITTTVTEPQDIDSDPGVIGRNVTGWHLILRRDDSGRLYEAPFGCAGEIAIAGHSLARGYLNNPSLTAQQFVDLPLLEGSPLPSRVYLTGDIGRYELDGSVRILGRRDRMIKINGIRVDPGEAEHRLRKLGDSFASAVVQCIVDQNGISKLAAFVPASAVPESKERLILVDSWTSEFRKMCGDGRRQLLELLPRAYVPSLFIPVSYIPSTMSDKVDYKRLRDELRKVPLENLAMSDDEEAEVEDDTEAIEPSTPMERIMSAVFKKVFPTGGEFGVTADFFRLGGDSFSAMKLVSAAKEHNLEITVQQIYRHPRLKDLAAVARYKLGKNGNGDKRSSVDGQTQPANMTRVLVSEDVWNEVAEQFGLGLDEIEDVYPATPFQQGLMAVSMQGKGTYSAKMAFELGESVDVSRLTRAVEGVVLDTPILRTSLVSSTQGLMQVVRKGSFSTSDAKTTGPFQYQIDTTSAPGRPRLRIEMHHSLYDGPTIEILLRDVNSRYAHPGYAANSAVPYRKFVDYLESTDSEAAREFWEKTLHDAPLATFPPCEDEARVGATQHVRLTTTITLEATKKCGISAGTLVAGATALLLGAYSFADQVCFGMTFSGRDIPELENIAGPTLSTVPICVAILREQEASGFLEQVQNLVVDMRQHQHYGLQNIAQLPAQGPRNAARFRTLLVLQQGSDELASTEQGSDIIGNLIDDESSMHVEYPLVIIAHANPATGSVDLKVEFDPACLSSVEATRFIQQLSQAIAELSQPHRAVSKLNLITAFDKEQISMWNPKPPKAPGRNICQMFQEKALRQPDSPAVESLMGRDGDAPRRQLTYRQLDTESTMLSGAIQRHAWDKRWVVLCHRDPASVVMATLATWKAGKAVVTIDPTVPADRRHTLLAELGDALILTEASEVQTFVNFQVHVLDGMLHDVDGMPNQSSSVISEVPVSSDIAYVFFTSGSSGTPKGVVVPHSAIALSLSDVSENMGLNTNTRMLQFASCSFDTSLMEIFATLITGGCVCIPTRNQRIDGTLGHAANSLQVTHMILTPTVASLLQPAQLPSVQCLMLVGEPPSTQVIEKWTSRDVSRRVQIMNGYGPTEAAVHSSTNFDLSEIGPRNIGKATACAMFLVLPDDPNRLAPVGTVGELVICGETVSGGYLNQPDLTRHVFGVNPPWAPWPGLTSPVRYYQTGDLACYCHDGSMVYLGRKDLQAKIHGQRLDVSEIEWHIRRCGGVSDCVVEVLQESTLVAFILMSQGSTEPYAGPLAPSQIDASAVTESQSRLRSVLPDYMIPSVYVPCSSWPMTTSGKTDRRRLRASVESSIDQYRIRQKLQRRPAQTQSQKKLFDSIEEVMSIPQDQISLDDSVLSLGGDSIIMIRLLAVARQRKLNIDATKAFRSTTLENLAASAEGPPTKASPVAVNGHHGPLAPFSLLPASSKDPHQLSRMAAACNVPVDRIIDAYPCTAIQEDLMVASAKTPGAFLNQEVFRLPAQVSVSKVSRSIDALWKRHDILRARIILDQDYRALQVVLREDAAPQETSTDDLQQFLLRDSLVPLEYGTRLSRCALLSAQGNTYLVLTQHHAVFDGWSMNILKDDLRALYFEGDSNFTLTQPYASFVRHSLQIYNCPDARQYWQNQLADAQTAPLPQAQSSMDSSTNQKYAFTTASVNNTDYSLAVLAEAAWGTLLGRYLDCEDVLFGVIRSGRTVPIPGIDTLMGPTIASIPRRLRPTKEQSVQAYLQQVQREIFEATQWEQYGLSNIRKVSKSASQACKFHSMLVVQPPAANETADNPAALLTSQAELAKGFINSDCLIVDVQATAKDEITVSIIYDDRVTSKDDAHWMAYHFSQTLAQLSSSGAVKLGNLRISGSDRLSQEQEWNSTDIEASHRLVDEIFTTNVSQWSGLPAVHGPDASLTYAQLDALSSAGAQILRSELGVRRGDLVPLLMTKSSVMIASMLAILKAGAAYVPLPTDAPRERLHFLIKETEARIVLCTFDHYELAQSLEIEAAFWDVEQLYESAPSTSGETENALMGSSHGDSRSPSDLAYILFTSGSTGTPKGVMIEHSALATTALVNGIKMNYQVGTRTLSFAAYTFDVNVIEIYLTLLHGGCLYIPSAERRLGDLSGFINDCRIELAFLTPTTIQNLLGSPSLVPSLKTLRSGGEPLSKSILREWSPSVCLINSYGPTETCVDACRNPDMKTDCDPNNIGFAIGTHLWVVERGNYESLAPVGCPGELLISGPTLARGYFKDEARTRACFIDGIQYQWVRPGEERLYATGDIVTRNADGSITYIGRRDLQVKLNGFRIELGEVEYNLEQCPAVVSAVVDKVASREGGSDQLVAFLRITQQAQSDNGSPLLSPSGDICDIIEGVQARIDGVLPPYMVPRVYLPLARIPLTLSNKTDRKALKTLWEKLTPEQILPYQAAPAVLRQPASVTERILQGLWAQVLKIDPKLIGLDTQFTRVGGDSLNAIGLASLCRELGFKFEVADILRIPQLEAMARHVEENRRVAKLENQNGNIKTAITNDAPLTEKLRLQAAEACGLSPDDIEEVYPCAPIQESLMASTLRQPGSYIDHSKFTIPQSADISRFRNAWQLVHEANPIMRTRICAVSTPKGMRLMQVVTNCPSEWIDDDSEPDSAMRMELGAPLVRYRLRPSGERFVFETWRHHAVFDGFSSAALWDDLQHAFETAILPRARPPYRAFVDFIQRIESSEAISFWEDQLNGHQPEPFPVLPSPDYVPQASSKTSQTLSGSLIWDSTSPFTFSTIVRAAWAVILAMRSRSSGIEKDVCFATTLSGRTAPLAGIDAIIGPTIATVPVRIQFDVDADVTSLLQKVQDQALDMLPFEHLGLGRIREINQSARDACASANLLVIQPDQIGSDSLPLGLQRLTDSEIQDDFKEPFGLVVECVQNKAKDEISVSAAYDEVLLSKLEVTHILEHFQQMISALHQYAGGQGSVQSVLWQLALGADLQRVVEWNSRDQGAPMQLHDLVERAAEKYPDQLAIDCHDGQMSYTKLVEAADRLACILQRDYGVRPGDFVPICTEKSQLMIIGILGIMKAGAGYVPLDTNHPDARMQWIINEVNARVVVASPLQEDRRQFPVQKLVLTTERLSLATNTYREQLRKSSPNDVAYVIFTSGTSGTPKGVVMQHKAASWSILEHARRYRHDNTRHSLQFSSYVFDASVVDIFAVLASGGCVHVPSETLGVGDLEDYIRENGINFADLTPTVANLLDPAQVPSLTTLAIGGEMANRELLRKWGGKDSPVKYMVNAYGPTEAGIACAMGELTQASAVGDVGTPLAAGLWIVDARDHNRLVPIGCVGELIVTGETLAQGYLNRAEETRRAFLTDVPWLANTGERRLYKTGDLARFNINGHVELVGRREDTQVKFRGLRIELGEIETAIEALPQWASRLKRVAVAMIQRDEIPILASFIQFSANDTYHTPRKEGSIFCQPSDGFKAFVADVKKCIDKQLPSYMVPQLWLPVSDWPISASSKTNRKLLTLSAENLDRSQVDEYQRVVAINSTANGRINGTNGKAPSAAAADQVMGNAEGGVKEAIIQVLHKDPDCKIEPETDFFQLGGDSLTAIMLVIALRKRGIHVSAHDIFAERSVRGIAGRCCLLGTTDSTATNGNGLTRSLVSEPVESDGDSGTANSDFKQLVNWVERAKFEDAYPASDTQTTFLIEGLKWPRSYYGWFFFELSDCVGIDEVREACCALVARHSILRTSFHLKGGKCFQVVHAPSPSIDSKVLVCRNVPSEQCDIIDREVLHPVKFGEILTRFRLFIDPVSGARTLMLGLSHAQYDGFCLATIFNDLRLAYLGILNQATKPPGLRPFIEYSLKISEEETDNFWRKTIECSPMNTICDRVPTTRQPVMSESIMRTIPFKYKDRELSNYNYGALVKSAWALTLNFLTHSHLPDCSYVTFWNLVSGRFAPFGGAQDVVGPCINFIPTRIPIIPDKVVSDLVEDMQSQMIDCMPYEATPTSRIIKQSVWSNSLANFGTIFQYQNIPDPKPPSDDSHLPWSVKGGAVYGGGLLQSGACWMMAWPNKEGFSSFRFTYSPETLSPAGAEAVMTIYLDFLRDMNDDPSGYIRALEPSLKRLKLVDPPSTSEIPSPARVETPPALQSLESQVKAFWKQLLNPPRDIHSNDSFFNMGGDSIKAAELGMLCEKAGLQLTLQDILDFPTLGMQTLAIAGQVSRPERTVPKLQFRAAHELS